MLFLIKMVNINTINFNLYNIKKIYYYSFTKPGKNLTQIYDWATREKWLKEADRQILNKEYIDMSLLDSKEEFFQLLDFRSKQDIK